MAYSFRAERHNKARRRKFIKKVQGAPGRRGMEQIENQFRAELRTHDGVKIHRLARLPKKSKRVLAEGNLVQFEGRQDCINVECVIRRGIASRTEMPKRHLTLDWVK